MVYVEPRHTTYSFVKPDDLWVVQYVVVATSCDNCNQEVSLLPQMATTASQCRAHCSMEHHLGVEPGRAHTKHLSTPNTRRLFYIQNYKTTYNIVCHNLHNFLIIIKDTFYNTHNYCIFLQVLQTP